MSQPADAPDGSDPRILAPSDDEPDVKIAQGYSTGNVYHTSTCPTVKRMNQPHDVPISVAEWKGYSKCKRCDEQEGGDGYEHPGKGPRNGAQISQLLTGVDAITCLQIRALLLSGETQASTADILQIGKTTVGTHGRGECDCEHHGRQLTFDGDAYHPVKGEGVPRRITGYAPISERTCANIRSALVREGVSASLIATIFAVSEDTVRLHGRGECQHGHGTPAATFDAKTNEWAAEAEK